MMKDSEIINTSFVTYCEERGIKLPSAYRMVKRNMNASFKSAAKYDKEQPVIDQGLWALAGEWTTEHFYPVMGGSRVFTQEEVLAEMDMKTSCGYPWNRKFADKASMLADAKACESIGAFWDILHLPMDTMVPIWTCSQKVELRAVEKLAENSLRTFTASPIEHSVACNRLCLDMNQRFYGGGDATWSYVGTSKFLQGWDRLYRRLDVHPHAYELDESSFDASLFAQAMYGQRDIRWNMLREEDRTPDTWARLCNVYDSIVHSVIILENGELSQKHTGNPSGSSNTIVDNTMILYRLFAYAWLVLCEEIGRETSRSDFENNVEAALNGDDNTYTVSDECNAWFTPAAIACVWSAIGVTTKTPCQTSRPLKSVMFLSNGFGWDEGLGIWMPVPETERVLSSLCYGSVVDDPRWHLLRACALRLDSYGNVECRRVLSGYIEYLNHKYRAEMFGDVCRSGSAPVSMKEIRNVWKSDVWIEALYCGSESASGDMTLPSVPGDEFEWVAHKAQRPFKFSQQQQAPRPEIKQSLVSNIKMGKSAAAKARRAMKRAGKQRAQGPMRPPLFRNPQPVQGGKRKKNKKKSGSSLAGSVMRFGADSSGLNKSVGFTNRSVVEQYFQPRMEKVADLTGTAAFTMAQALYINPGNSTLFPIFSQEAIVYEQYRCNLLKFWYRSTEYTASGSNIGAGLVLLATNFDPDDAQFSTKNQMENYWHGTSDAPFAPSGKGVLCHDVCAGYKKNKGGALRDATLNNYYVNASSNTSAPTSQAAKFYDIGLFQLATAGNVASSDVIGELWVEYSFTMIHPKQNASLPQGTGAVHFSSIAATTADNFAGSVQQAGSLAPLTGISIASNVITFPAGMPGNYLLEMAVSGATSASGFAVNYTTGATALLLMTAAGVRNASSSIVSLAGTTTSSAVVSKTFTVASSGATLTVTPSTIVGAGNMDLFIVSLPPTVLTVVEEEESRISMLERQVERLLGLLSPPSLVDEEESKEEDECGSSSSGGVLLSRSLLTSLMRK